MLSLWRRLSPVRPTPKHALEMVAMPSWARCSWALIAFCRSLSPGLLGYAGAALCASNAAKRETVIAFSGTPAWFAWSRAGRRRKVSLWNGSKMGGKIQVLVQGEIQ